MSNNYTIRNYILIFLVVPAHSVYLQLPITDFYQLRQDAQLLSAGYFSLVQDDYGFIWMGSYWGGGLYRFDGYNLRSFVIDPTDLNRSLSSNNINNLACPGDNQVYVSSHGRLNTIDLSSGIISTHPMAVDKITDRNALFITGSLKDQTGAIWLSSSYGLSRYVPDRQIYQGMLPPLSTLKGPPPERIRAMLQDKTDEDLLWLGSFHGLFSYKISTNEYDFYESTPRIEVNKISQDKAGTLWLATQPSSVLVKFDPREKRFTPTNLSPILEPDEHIISIFNFKDSNIWLTTTKTVGIFDPEAFTYTHWNIDTTYHSGLMPNGDFAKIISDRHGRAWIGSASGVQYAKNSFLPPDPIKKDLYVHIIRFKTINERAEVPRPLSYNHSIALESDQRNLEIEYVLPNPLHPDQVFYQYKLLGYDDDWINTKNRNVRYSKLPGGTFTFLVKGKEDQSDFTTETSLNITIEKVLTEQWWFWLVSIGSLSFFIVTLVHIRFKSIRKEEQFKAKFKHDLAEVQMQALRSQMNPHFLFNSLNSLKYYVLRKSKKETAEYLSKFSLLVRTILNNSKQKSIGLIEELEAIKLYIEIENLRLENKFDFEVDIDPTIHTAEVSIPPMIMQPYVENAIWHGLMPMEEKGRLLIKVTNLGERIQCIIEDNGIGRKAAGELAQQNPKFRKSVGMQISRDRLDLLKQAYGIEAHISIIDLESNEKKALGTRVIIEIPVL